MHVFLCALCNYSIEALIGLESSLCKIELKVNWQHINDRRKSRTLAQSENEVKPIHFTTNRAIFVRIRLHRFQLIFQALYNFSI